LNIIDDVEYSEFVKFVNSGKQIICYGAGLVARATEDIFFKSGIDKSVSLFVDRDIKKRGTTFLYAGREVAINDVQYLCNINLSDKVLLLTLDAYQSAIDQLNNIEIFNNLDCFIYTKLNTSYINHIAFNDTLGDTVNSALNKVEKIPKAIHYCWFGGGEMPQFMKKCVNSWIACNTGYQLVKWNEDNFNVYQNNYIKQAYKAGKYAFVSDFARLDILYRHGGIYLDTDVEVLKRFDDLLHNDAFIAYNEWAVVNSAICGSIAGHEIIRRMRDEPRSFINFLNDDNSYNLTNNSIYETAVLSQLGFVKDFTYQLVGNISVYPPCFFPQKGKLGLNTKIDGRTYAVHYATGTWKSQNKW
jgi:hypothetical protein